MIKHNLKLKGQTVQTGKSLFYLTRRVVTSRVGTVVLNTKHFRSASTTPSKFRVSQNIDEGTRQQSTSINSAEILSQIKSHRVLSLYQQFDTVREESTPNYVVVKQNTQDLSEIEIPMNHKIKTRKLIFKNQTFQDYKKLQKFKKQETTTKWMFVQKVLKNIKDSQGEKSEQKQLTRKYSNVWKEGFQLTFPEQQKFAKSQTQLRLYINQYIEKIMNKKRIYNYNIEQLAFITQQDGLIHNKMHVTNIMRQFYIENHNIKLSTEVEVEEEQFRYSKDIKSYEFIISQDDIPESLFDIDVFFASVETKKLEYLQSSVPQKLDRKIKPIINLLDNKTKNQLLSVDYKSMDRSIYFNNISEIIPKIDEIPMIRMFIKKQMNRRFEKILTGHFSNLNDIDDIEHNNAYEQQAVFQVDKKAIMNNLRNKTKEAKQQGRRSTIQMSLNFQSNLLTQAKQELQSSFITLQVPENEKNRFSRRRSKSMYSEDVSQSQDFSSIQPLDVTPQDNRARPCKYKQQLRLQNLLMFEHVMKKDESVASIIQLLIEHNLVDELIDYLRQNPNFSLNQRNIEGKPYIVLAAQCGSLEIVQYMISRNVQLNVKDLDGNTPLHYAVGFQFYQIADELLKNGASPYIRNRLNLNAWNWQQYI